MDKIIVESLDSEKLTQTEREKIKLVKEKFENEFKSSPMFCSRAPGRVNLIGEHIDYCGYSVLPMAISNDILIACSKNNENTLHLVNVDPQFESFKCSTVDFKITNDKPQWYNYFLCGFKGIIERFNLEKPAGLNICIYGTVPKSSGLSSSSALVVCAALSTLVVNDLELTKTELAELCAISERYIGTQGGGMDQAISCLARKGTAKLIDFNPLRVSDICLPEDSLFVITNCCVEANKAATNHFNRRVVECRLSAQLLAKHMNLNWKEIKKIKDVQTKLSYSFDQMISLVKQKIHQQVYTKQELCDFLNVSHGELAETSLSQNTLDVNEFNLYNRALHVLSEAKRVYDFREVCLSNSKESIVKLGNLMNESHESCRDLYECSCPELDELTKICRKHGAYGSRLTGAGWGGCAVSMIPKSILDDFLNRIKIEYYERRNITGLDYDAAAFSTCPSDGILVFSMPEIKKV